MTLNQEKKHNNKKYAFKFNPFEIFIEGNESFNKAVFCKNILANLSEKLNTAYIVVSPEKLSLTSKKNKNALEFKSLDLVSEKTIALDFDLVLVNQNIVGNSKKIVFLDQEYNYDDNLENIILFTGKEKFYKKELSNIPFIDESEIKQISEKILESYIEPEIYGLVLTGGKSIRMGQDKAFLNFHGKNQYEYIYELLEKYCKKTYISCRESQKDLYKTEFNKIYDKFNDIGPSGGILSALSEHTDKSWLVIACDLPYIEQNVIQELINQRNSKKYATAYISSSDNLPEPLCAIYEPKSKIRMMQFLSIGYDCPRKFLINSEVKLINQTDPKYLTNINNYSEYENYLNEK